LKKQTKDVIVVGYDLYYSILNVYGQVDVQCLNTTTGKDKQMHFSSFNLGPTCHYYPEWAKPECNVSNYGLQACYLNEANIQFNVLPKRSEKQRETLQKEKVISHQYCIEGKDIQTLLWKNKTLALTKPLEFVATHFYLSPDILSAAIGITVLENEYVPILQMETLDPKCGFYRMKQISRDCIQ
jgi:hypothetical protein